MSTQTKISWTVETRTLISGLTALLLLLSFAPAMAATYVQPRPPTIKTLPILNANVVPVSAGHQWKKSSTSGKTFIDCMVKYGVESKYNLRVQQFTNKIPKSLAFTVYATALTARPTDVADVLQTCLNSVENPTESNSSGGVDYANVGVNKGIRSYAAATMYNGVMVITYWAQPSAPALVPSPAVAMIDRTTALYELAAQGISSPNVVQCKGPGTSGLTTVPSQV